MTQQQCLEMLEEGKFLSLSILKDKLIEKEERIKNLEEQVKMLLNNKDTSFSGNNNSNCNNTVNINVFNIQSHSSTDYDSLKNDIIKCLEDQDPQLKVPSFEKIIEKIHFDNDHPENHNIYKPNFREDKVLTYNGKSFIVDKNATDTLLKKLENVIEDCVKDDETKRECMKKLTYHLKLKQEDFEYLEATKKDINTTLYNGRDIVKQTQRKLKSIT
jgi:hypothetical protein